ncbi:hypothetical protein UT300018_14830 [Clostridium faecium]
MKNIIYKIKIFIINHFFILILLLFLILSVFFNINAQNKLNKYKNTIYGTYMRQGQSMDELEYFVFEKDKFYHYIPFKLLDKGDYNEIYENVYFLKGNNDINDFIIKGVIKDNEVIYFKDKDPNNINIYSKISDVPTFINMEIKK